MGGIMLAKVCRSFPRRTGIVLLGILMAVSAFGQDLTLKNQTLNDQGRQDQTSKVSGQILATGASADKDSSQAPLVITLQDALTRAKANDPKFRAALTDLGLAH